MIHQIIIRPGAFLLGIIATLAIGFFYAWAMHGDLLTLPDAWGAPDEQLRPWFRVLRRLIRRKGNRGDK